MKRKSKGAFMRFWLRKQALFFLRCHQGEARNYRAGHQQAFSFIERRGQLEFDF